jgi:hypothetical protein
MNTPIMNDWGSMLAKFDLNYKLLCISGTHALSRDMIANTSLRAFLRQPSATRTPSSFPVMLVRCS